jgi:hypothetical protein
MLSTDLDTQSRHRIWIHLRVCLEIRTGACTACINNTPDETRNLLIHSHLCLNPLFSCQTAMMLSIQPSPSSSLQLDRRYSPATRPTTANRVQLAVCAASGGLVGPSCASPIMPCKFQTLTWTESSAWFVVISSLSSYVLEIWPCGWECGV